VPIIQRWRELGYSDAEIEQMLEDKQREDEFGLVDFPPATEQ
jgi:DNA-binding transcriptional MerR regulator